MDNNNVKYIIEKYHSFIDEETKAIIQYLFEDMFSKYIYHDDEKIYDIVCEKLKNKNINIDKEKIKEVIDTYINYIVYIYILSGKKVVLEKFNGHKYTIRYNKYKIRYLREHLMKKAYFGDENI